MSEVRSYFKSEVCLKCVVNIVDYVREVGIIRFKTLGALTNIICYIEVAGLYSKFTCRVAGSEFACSMASWGTITSAPLQHQPELKLIFFIAASPSYQRGLRR